MRGTPEPPPPPQFPYDAEKGIPITEDIPDVSLLQDPLSVKESFALSHSLAQSRNRWLSGAMFTKFWTRPPRGRKLAEGEVNAREKMTKLCECLMAIGPHIFDVKLFIVKGENDDNPNGSAEPEDKNPQQDVPNQDSNVPQEPAEDKQVLNETSSDIKSEPQRESVEPVAQDPKLDPALTGTSDTANDKPPEPIQPQLAPTISVEPNPPVEEPAPPKDSTPVPTDPALPSQPTPTHNLNNPNAEGPVRPPPPQGVQDAQSQRSPTPTAASVASNPNNMATIMKLQAIARIDRSLNSLMKIVASGNATSEQITAFQAYINGARSMELEDIPRFFKPVPDPDGGPGIDPLGKGKGKKKDGGPRKPGKPRGRTAGKYQKKNKDGEVKKKDPNKPKNSYVPKKLQKKVTIVFEFKDNPADRYIIPKNSIIEILPTNEVLISFLLLFPEGGIAVRPNAAQLPPGNVKVKKEGEDDNNPVNETALIEEAEIPEDTGKPKCFYPLTVTLRNMPVKSLPILERSVNKPAIVAEYMAETMNARIRAKNWWVWFQIDKRDEELLSQLVLPAKPPENMFIPARVRVYKSKKKSKEDAEKKKKKNGENGENEEEEDDAAVKPEDEGNETMDHGGDDTRELSTAVDDSIREQPSASHESVNVDPSLFSKEESSQPGTKDPN